MRAYMYEHYPHPGTSVNNAVIGAMRDSSEIVSFLTDGGASSAWVHQELGAALALGKPVVPVVEVTAVQAPGFMPLNRPVLFQPQHPEPALGELLCLLRADFNMMDTDISVQCPSCQSYWKVPLPRIHEARTAMEMERPLARTSARAVRRTSIFPLHLRGYEPAASSGPYLVGVNVCAQGVGVLAPALLLGDWR